MLRKQSSLAKRRALKAIATASAVIAAAFATSQTDDTLNFPPDVVGAASIANIGGGGGAIPIKVDFISTATNSNNMIFDISQYETYSTSAKIYSPVNVNVHQSSWQSTSGIQRLFFALDLFWAWRATNSSNASRQWGSWRAKITRNGATLWYKEWHITPENINEVGGWANGGGGNSGNPGGSGTSTNPSDTGGFWASLFIPSEESLNAFKAKLQELSQWGPLGIYQVISSSAQSQFESSTSNHLNSDLDTPFVIPIQVPKFQQTGSPTQEWQYIDLSPWAEYIAFIRLLISAFLWWAVLRYIWRRVEKKI